METNLYRITIDDSIKYLATMRSENITIVIEREENDIYDLKTKYHLSKENSTLSFTQTEIEKIIDFIKK